MGYISKCHYELILVGLSTKCSKAEILGKLHYISLHKPRLLFMSVWDSNKDKP
jgi:hypothetical protein